MTGGANAGIMDSMIGYLEGNVLLFPSDAGGRQTPITPRDGSYRVFAGVGMLRFIEGPPSIAPGHEARVVAEVESPLPSVSLSAGDEIELVEEERVIGLLLVTRLWRTALAV